MSPAPPQRETIAGLKRLLKRRADGRATVIDGEARFVDERPERIDPVVFWYGLYERAAAPVGLILVGLGVAFLAIGLLLSGKP